MRTLALCATGAQAKLYFRLRRNSGDRNAVASEASTDVLMYGFDALLTQLRAEFEPIGVLENFTVERIALGMVRRQRGERLEAAFLDADVPKEIDPIQSIMGNAEADAPLSASTVDNLCNLAGRYETATARRLTADVSLLLSLQRERRSLASFRNSGGNG
jgi:hypothetical protein